MRNDLKVLVFALSSAGLLFGTAHAQAWGTSTYVMSAVVTVEPGATGDAQALCNGSDFATGGGFMTGGTTVSDSFPVSDASGEPTADGADPHGWRVITFNATDVSSDLRAFVVCLASNLVIVPLH